MTEHRTVTVRDDGATWRDDAWYTVVVFVVALAAAAAYVTVLSWLIGINP